MGEYILTIDQGTTGSRAMVLDAEAKERGRSYSEFRQIYPQPGWVEHDPEEIWQVTEKVIAEAIAKAGIRPRDLVGIGITNQRETTVVWDRRTGKPVMNAIVWQCRRTADRCHQLRRKRGLVEKFRKKTGLVIDAYFSGTKIEWILNHVDGAKARAKAGELAFGTMDSWLIWKLTSGKTHATDYTNASRTLIFNIDKKKWDQELLDLLGIPAALLPEVKPSAGLFGRSTCAVLPDEVPITGVAGDQQAALFGQGCTAPGMIKNTYGTGCFTLVYLGDKNLRSRSGLVTTLCCSPSGGPAYALEGSIFITGAAVQWLRDELKLIKNAAETEAIAASVADTGGVYLVPAFVGLGAPYWDGGARGAMLGLTRGSNAAHLTRATLESIAYQTRDLLLAVEKDLKAARAKVALQDLRVDGGACANNFLMQFQADILDLPVNRPTMVETTALGAAFLAGMGAGLWKDAKVLAELRKVDRVFKPAMSKQRREELYAGWLEAVGRVLTRGRKQRT
jgi:glycerol kinase